MLVGAAARDLNGVAYDFPVLLEHGSGQSYIDAPGHPAYTGGRRRERLAAVLAPNVRVALGHERAVVIGCPKLDPWHRTAKPPPVTKPVVGVSFHWDCPVSQESGSAFATYTHELERLVAAGHRVLGHWHPRDDGRVQQRWAELGVETTPHFNEILDRADLYICDNSSTLFEFASTGRPVLVLNDPSWRRDVEHGMRFWEYADVGLQVDTPDQLLINVDEALRDPPEVRRRRAEVSRAVYAWTDGQCSRRAADALLRVLKHGKILR